MAKKQEQGLKAQYRFSEVPMSEVLDEFDHFEYKVQDKLNIKITSIPSLFITSRLELNLNKTLAKLNSAKLKSTQFLREISNSRQKPII